jgi:hypothetical protein
VVHFTSQPHYFKGKIFHCPFDRRLSRLYSQAGQHKGEKIPCPYQELNAVLSATRIPAM